MQIQNFQLSVTPLGSDRYLIRTEQVEPGVPLAEVQVAWPVADWLAHAQQAMDDPLVSLLQTQPTRGGAATLDTLTLDLRQLGQELYNALFTDALRDSWVAAQSIAHHQAATLRLRLGLRGDRLSRLPWEVLHAPLNLETEQFQPLTTGTEILFSRYQAATPRTVPALSPTLPLKILMVVTQPDDLGSLDLPQEIRHLKAELERGPTPAQLTLLEQPSRQDLAQVLEQGQYHVFHYAGHSDLGETGGTIHLVNPTTGGTESLMGDDLAGLLVNNGVQLAVFNSCRSSDTTFGTADAQSLSHALVQRGVPAVLAMAEQVPDEVSLAFTRLLYRNVLQGHPLDLALSRARQGLLSSYGSSHLYWALPVLYLQPQSQGVLIPEAATDASTAAIPQWLQEELVQEAKANADEATAQPTANPLAANPDSETAALVEELLADFQAKPGTQHPSPTPTLRPATVTVNAPSRRAKLRSRLILASSIAAIALAGSALSWQFWQSRPTAPPQVSLNVGGANPASGATSQLTGEAIAAISTGDYPTGLAAVTQLLDNNAVSSAQAVLGNIPAEDLDDPAISYLRGRLAWQGWQTGDAFQPDDARRFWAIALEGDDTVVAHPIALGFAYYEEGLLNQAIETWRTALAQVEQQDASNPQEQATIDAGLAIALKRLAQSPSPERNDLFLEAQRLRDRALQTAPEDFTQDALAQNWLWTETAIQDWQTGWVD
ncbi:MAG: CHAT domain-containing protein [Cyanobacteria bacterium P01_G01_bin.54]